jgi:hypothetical protein
MIRAILVGIGVVVATVLVYAAMQPDEFRIERAARIEAAPADIAARIVDLRRFNEWNPYAKKDPAMKAQYTGPSYGPGAAYSWESEEVGTGSMKIVDVELPSRVALALDFESPFEAHNMVEFTLVPQGNATDVTWKMTGAQTYPSKLMGLLFDVDEMVGGDFEAGLANLKALAER